MKRGGVLVFAVFLFLVFTVFVVNSCKKGSGLLGPGYVRATPTPTFTPDANFLVYIHQEGTPVIGLKLDLTYNNDQNLKLTAKTDKNGTGSFKVNEYGKWSLLVNSFDDFKSQVFIVEPVSNTFFCG